MENAILITTSNASLDKIGEVTHFNFRKESENVLHYSAEDHFLSLIHADAGADEYEEEELAEVKLKISNPIFFVLDTNSFDLLKKFIISLPDSFNFLIDNDFGEIFTKQEFLEFNSFEAFFASPKVQA